MRVLVTGAGGFIGRFATQALLAAGHDVYGVFRTPPRDLRSHGVPRGLHVISADLDGEKRMEQIFDVARPDAAVHLAWYTNPADLMHEPWQNLRSLERTLALLRVARSAGCGRVVLAGTCLEHADRSPVAASAYAVTKRAAHAVADRLPPGEMRVACAHIFWVYGPHEHPGRAVPSVVQSLLRGTPLDVTSGTQLREYLHVADVAAALCAVLVSDLSGRVDVATGRPVPLRAVFESIAAAVGGADLLRWGARPSGADDSYEVQSDPRPLRSLGTWQPRYSLAAGIADTVSWWRGALRLETGPRPMNDASEGARQ